MLWQGVLGRNRSDSPGGRGRLRVLLRREWWWVVSRFDVVCQAFAMSATARLGAWNLLTKGKCFGEELFNFVGSRAAPGHNAYQF